MSKKSAERRLIELAGQYAVAAQMSLLGWHPSPTVGNFPDIDLIAYNIETNKRLTIQVKTGRGRWGIGTAKKDGDRWRIDGLAENADIYVLVDLTANELQKAEFYIIPTKELKQIVEKYAQLKYGRRHTEKDQPCWINRTLPDHQEEWKEIAKYTDWNVLNKFAK